MSADQVALWYLIASICFILALKGLSHPTTARRGNVLGIIGMAIAVLVTLALVTTITDAITTALPASMKASIFFVIRARSGPRFCSRQIPLKNVTKKLWQLRRHPAHRCLPSG